MLERSESVSQVGKGSSFAITAIFIRRTNDGSTLGSIRSGNSLKAFRNLSGIAWVISETCGKLLSNFVRLEFAASVQ
jgi:hypothetical protein